MCGSAFTPMFVYLVGKLETVLGPRTTTAMPRYSVNVPIVTASEGKPTRVTRNPLKQPAAAPTATTEAITKGIDHPRL